MKKPRTYREYVICNSCRLRERGPAVWFKHDFFRNGLTLMGVSSVYQLLITGVLVILAVTTDQLSRGGAR